MRRMKDDSREAARVPRARGPAASWAPAIGLLGARRFAGSPRPVQMTSHIFALRSANMWESSLTFHRQISQIFTDRRAIPYGRADGADVVRSRLYSPADAIHLPNQQYTRIFFPACLTPRRYSCHHLAWPALPQSVSQVCHRLHRGETAST